MKFGISGNYDKEELPRVIGKLISLFKDEGLSYVLPAPLVKKMHGKIDKKLLSNSIVVSEAKLAKSCDILISLGGDGTILRMARLINGHPTPILGINLGKLGFLAEVSLEEIDECIHEIIKGEYIIEDRMMLQAEMKKMKNRMHALNDIVIDQSESSRMFSVQTFVNGEFLSKFTGDGIIIATPTGSTAYALSNGGPIVTPSNNAILISPICPHTLTARTVVVPGDSIITLRVETSSGKIHLTADGQPQKFLKPPIEVTVEKSTLMTKLVKRKNTSYYDVLRRKLHWGKDVRNA